MTLIIAGATACKLCGQVIQVGQPVVGFGPFVGNELDPLYLFSDAAMHESCFYAHSLASAALARHQEVRDNSGPGNRHCIACRQSIDDPDDYLFVGYLVSDPNDPLFQYNHAKLHKHCLEDWCDRDRVRRLLNELAESGRWKGAALQGIIREFN